MIGHACVLVSSLHAFRCPIGRAAYVFVRLVVVHGVVHLRVIGLTA